MTTEWTAEQRNQFLKECGLRESGGDLVIAVLKVPMPPLNRARREMHIPAPDETPVRQILLSEWQLKASYLGLAANVSEDDRRICEIIRTRHYLRSEDGAALERIWFSCLQRDRADAANH